MPGVYVGAKAHNIIQKARSEEEVRVYPGL